MLLQGRYVALYVCKSCNCYQAKTYDHCEGAHQFSHWDSHKGSGRSPSSRGGSNMHLHPDFPHTLPKSQARVISQWTAGTIVPSPALLMKLAPWAAKKDRKLGQEEDRELKGVGLSKTATPI